MGAREWIWLGVTAAGLLIVYLSPLHEHLTHLQVLNADIQRLGHWGPLFFILFTAVITAMGFPRMLMYPIGGMAFGFAWGMVWCMAGSLFGAYMTFSYARWAGSAYIRQRWPRIQNVADFFTHNSVMKIVLIRQLPSPGFLTNLLLGISPVGHFTYILGTMIGSLPSSIPATLIGSSTIQTSAGTRMLYILASIACLVILWSLSGVYIRHSPRFEAIRKSISPVTPSN